MTDRVIMRMASFTLGVICGLSAMYAMQQPAPEKIHVEQVPTRGYEIHVSPWESMTAEVYDKAGRKGFLTDCFCHGEFYGPTNICKRPAGQFPFPEMTAEQRLALKNSGEGDIVREVPGCQLYINDGRSWWPVRGEP